MLWKTISRYVPRTCICGAFEIAVWTIYQDFLVLPIGSNFRATRASMPLLHRFQLVAWSKISVQGYKIKQNHKNQDYGITIPISNPIQELNHRFFFYFEYLVKPTFRLFVLNQFFLQNDLFLSMIEILLLFLKFFHQSLNKELIFYLLTFA